MSTHWLDPARALLRDGSIDLVTCDVFDTLVWRAVATPADQFHHVAERLHARELLPPHVPVPVFTEGRMRAERSARNEVRRNDGHPEVTLSEIWDRMPTVWFRPDQRAAGADVELEVEAERIRLHPDVAALVDEARALEVDVVLVSDVYLSADQLRRVLDGAGAPLGSIREIVTSSDHRLGKADGLLEQVIEEHGVAPNRVLHLGDNPISDVETATALGCQVVATDVMPADRVADAVCAALTVPSRLTGTDGGTSATVRTTLVRAGALGHDPAYQFGAAVGGPVFTPFAAWVNDSAAAFGVDHVHYLLREGAFIAELAGIVRPDGPSARLVHASRWVNMRAAVLRGTSYEIARAVLRRAALEAAHVTECFGVDRTEVERVIGVGAIPDDQRWAAFDALATDDAIRDAIVAASTEIRGRLMRHLDTALAPSVVDGRERIVVADIGWGGTIQEGLADVLHHEGRDVDVIGLYLLLSEPGVDRVHQGARMSSYLPSDGAHARRAAVVSRNPELLEELCTPPLGTFVDLDPDGTPVLADVPDHAPESRARARCAIVEYASIANESGLLRPGDALIVGDAHRAALLDGVSATLQSPDPRLAVELSTWSHDDVAGTAAEGLVHDGWARALPHLDAATAQGVSMREIFWLAGAAAVANPTLAAQLDATRHGVDPERLCPPSELGGALVAVYRPGSDQAVLLHEHVPATGAHGRMLLRTEGTVPAVRNVRVDFGDRAGLVELAFVEVRLTLDDETVETLEVTRTDDPRIHWGDAHPVSPQVVSVGADGHLVITVDPTTGARCRHIAVRAAFRAWPTEVPTTITRRIAGRITPRLRTSLASLRPSTQRR